MAVLWGLLIILVNPVGEFPFGDDWGYIGPSKHFAETGEIKLGDWPSMTLVLQVLIGGAAIEIFGFSFLTMRLLGLSFGFMGAVGAYYLFSYVTQNKKAGIFGAAMFSLNPVYFALSFTYSTDVPFMAFAVWAFYFYIKFLYEEKNKFLLWAILFNAASILIREVSLVLAGAFAVSYMLKYKFEKKAILKSMAVLIAALLVFGLWRLWMENVHGMTKTADLFRVRMLDEISKGAIRIIFVYIKNIAFTLIFVGLYFFPMILPVYQSILRYKTFKVKLFSYSLLIFGAAGVVTALKISGRLFERLNEFVLSPLLTHTKTVEMNDRIYYGSIFDIGFSASIPFYVIASSGAIMLLIITYYQIKKVIEQKSIKSLNRETLFTFNLSYSLAYILPVFLVVILNRYLLLLYPALIIFLLNSGKIEFTKAQKYIYLFLFLFFAYLSISSARGLLEFNRARWQGIEIAQSEYNAKNEEIDGGFEFNAWHFYDFEYKEQEGKNWYWVQDDKYIISWGKYKNYEILDSLTYYLWFPPGYEGKIYVQKRNN